MEIEAPLRTTGRGGRNTPAYPPDERRQSVVGSTEDPWRAAQAWHRCRPDQRGQIYGAEEGSSVLVGNLIRLAVDCFVTASSSLSAPRLTIIKSASGNGLFSALASIPWRSHPHVPLFVRRQDHRHGLGVNRRDDAVRFGL